MAIDMEEVVGQENMAPEAKDTVMDLLRELPLAAQEIKHAFFDWARQSGYTPTAQDAGAVAGARKKRKP
jgi:hypothetical protein